MKASNIFLAVSAAAAGAVLYLYKKTKNESYGWMRDTIKVSHTEEENETYKNYISVKAEADKIRDEEHNELLRMKSGIQGMYNSIATETSKIENKERNILAGQDVQYQSDISKMRNKVDCLLAKENSLYEDIRKSDDTIKALKTAKKALKKAEKSTDEVERKIKKREEELRSNVVTARTEAEKTLIKDLHRAEKEYADRDSRIRDIRDARTPEERDLFIKKNELLKDLSDDRERKAIIKSNRTEATNEILNRFHLLKKEVDAIQEKDIRKLEDHKTGLFGRYLKNEMNLSKGSVIFLAAIPMVPVGILVAKYIDYVFTLVKNME